MKKDKKYEDKIFNNAYNRGDIKFDFFNKLKIKDGFDPNSEEFIDASFSEWENTELREKIYEIFINSKLKDIYIKNKKVLKNEMFDIFYFFYNRISKEKYTFMQIFIEIVEFMKMNYKDMFYLLMPKDKQQLIKEIDDKYKILKKKKIKRLF